MHSKLDSIRKRWHSLKASPGDCARKWDGAFWRDVNGFRVVSCRDCPSFDAGNQQCSINFGSPLRKCVVSSIEAHFHDGHGKNMLEIGCGRFKLARNLIRKSGGRWTGVDPKIPKSAGPVMGKACHGHAAEIPFADGSFDRVFAVQSVEHWGQKFRGPIRPYSYAECLSEIHRVLKPGGEVYLDAPVHFHGHEMFIMGDISRIKSIFPETHWKNLQFERWREDCAPLEPYRTPKKVLEEWPVEISSYPPEQVKEARTHNAVWLMVITANKT